MMRLRSLVGATAVAVVLATSLSAPAMAEAPQGLDPDAQNLDSGTVAEAEAAAPSADHFSPSGAALEPPNPNDTGIENPYFHTPLPLKSYNVTSYFGARCLVMLNSGTYHGAIDLAAPTGTPIYAMDDGKVVNIIQPKGHEVGGAIEIDHGLYRGQRLIISYTHTWEPDKYFKVGDSVERGDIVAPVGDSGIANGPHVHLAVYYHDNWIDPETFFLDSGLNLLSGANRVAVKEPSPTSCDVFNHGTIGLKSKADYTSSVIQTIPDGTKFKITPGVPINGHVPAVLSNGKTGWVRVENLSNKPRVEQPELPATEQIEAGFSYSPYSNLVNVRDYPSTDPAKSGLITTADIGDILISTGRQAKGTDWMEFYYNGSTVWSQKAGMEILNRRPSLDLRKGEAGDKAMKSGELKPIPTIDLAARLNKAVPIAAGTKVTATGDYYRDWAEVKALGETYWTRTSNLGTWIDATPPVKPTPKDNPAISKGDFIGRDGSGNLWNYGNLYSKPKNRVQIGSGWGGFRDVISVDFDGDGVMDLIGNTKAGKLLLYPGYKAGGFGAPKTIGTNGWAVMELHVGKMKSGDKYPSLLTRSNDGKIYHYEGTGSGLKGGRIIGTGWKGFRSISIGHFDNDGKLDVVAQNTAGQQILYRTNGSGFINEKRPVVGSGWGSLRSSAVGSAHGINSSGMVAVDNSGRLLYYGFKGNRQWNAAKVVGASGWKPFYIVKTA